MTFDEWMFNLCERLARGRKEVTDVYSTLDLSTARLAFLDGV